MNINPEPPSSYPRGTEERIIPPKVTSEEEFRVDGTEIEENVGRRCWRSDNPEVVMRTASGEKRRPGSQERRETGKRNGGKPATRTNGDWRQENNCVRR
ncbi:hypothetical protein NDU88_005990 [Pleurodeles waltl]|uniref:Uncharacterized protein n=1 Tax=Pleurodeles waltl TaxID=8319 RepID=A0AAV7NQJ5_PLEWA|nr:hypothetical protein NDU88_005990 [Pleurodeles waltl]